MVDIIVGTIPTVFNNQNKKENPRGLTHKKKSPKEKRRNKQDRRRDVRSGVVVTLSTFPDRRSGVDRRKKTAS